jgi:hypothetical protein
MFSIKNFRIKSFIKNHWFQVIIVLIALLILRFSPLLNNKTLLFGDNYSLMVPGKIFTAHWLKQGILPLWNSTIFTGLPWIGDVNQSILYPSTFLFMWLSPSTALNLILILHIIFTFIGMYLVSKKLIANHRSALFAAIIWTLSTQITAVLNNISTVQSLTWLPWIVYSGLFVTRSFKYRLFFVLAVFMQFAGGYPTHVLYSILLAVFFSFLEREECSSRLSWFLDWLQTGIFSIALSAVIWLPFIEVLLTSTRFIQTMEQSLSGSLHPLELIKVIIPYFFDHPSMGLKWGPSWNSMPNVSVYFSWIGLLILGNFIFKAKKNKKDSAWLALFLLTLLFSLGQYLPLNLAFLIGPSRGPSTALIITTFLAALIIGKDLVNYEVKKIHLVVALIIFGLGVVNYYLMLENFGEIWKFFNQITNNRLANSAFHTLEKDQFIVNVISTNLLANSFLFLIVLIFLYKKKTFLLFVILIIDLTFNTQGMLFFAPKNVYRSDNSKFIFQDDLKSDTQSRALIRNYNAPYTDFGAYWEAIAVRIPFSDSYIDKQELTEFNHLKRMSQGMTPDWNMVAGVNILNGYTTLMPQKMNQLWNESADSNPAINNLPEIKINNPLLSQWSVKYYLVDNWFDVKEDLSEFQKIAEKDYWTLYQLPALNRFRFVGETLENQDELDFQLELENYSETPNKIEFNFNNPANHQYLIIADRYDPNWTAVVNGRSVEVQEFNHMRRIPIKPGFNQVKLTYRPKYFYYGIAISFLALVAGIGGVVAEHRSKKFNF